MKRQKKRKIEYNETTKTQIKYQMKYTNKMQNKKEERTQTEKMPMK